jgi:hypothetical protein
MGRAWRPSGRSTIGLDRPPAAPGEGRGEEQDEEQDPHQAWQHPHWEANGSILSSFDPLILSLFDGNEIVVFMQDAGATSSNGG